jgi:hypothetical protein
VDYRMPTLRTVQQISPAKKKLPDREKVSWVDNLVCAQLPSDSNKSDLMARFDLLSQNLIG